MHIRLLCLVTYVILNFLMKSLLLLGRDGVIGTCLSCTEHTSNIGHSGFVASLPGCALAENKKTGIMSMVMHNCICAADINTDFCNSITGTERACLVKSGVTDISQCLLSSTRALYNLITRGNTYRSRTQNSAGELW